MISFIRVGIFIALLANIVLYRIAGPEDAFAIIISLASLLAACSLFIGFWYKEIGDAGALLAVGVWATSATELIGDSTPRWETQFRVGGFLIAFLIITLALYWLTADDGFT
jgi:hypothetical protein